MFQRSHTAAYALRRGLGLVAIFATLSLSANGVLAARGGKPEPTTGTLATAVFDDLADDAIGSDGLGSYDATIENGTLTLSTGKKRGLFLDFSDCLHTLGSCDSPFGSSDSATKSQVTMTLDLIDGTALIEFNGAGGEYLLASTVDVLAFDDDGNGSTDRYVVDTTGTAGHALFLYSKRGGRGLQPNTPRYWWQADFSMPWGIEVTTD